jgi:rhodanese-related sulfurtransferase
MTLKIKRAQRNERPHLVPQPIPELPWVVQVDTTWGTIEPMQVAEGVRTVGEVEVIEHLEQGLPVVDARTSDFLVEATIPGSVNIPYPEAVARMSELNREQPTVFFCNGPQCGQSPTAIRALLEAGYPPDKILYYRGGLHDWLTLGLPVVPGGERG